VTVPLQARMPGWTHRLAPGAVLRTLLARRGTIETPLGRGWLSELAVLRETRRRVPLLLNDAAALQIQLCVRAARRVAGVMAEAGVFKGGSARLICAAKGATPLHLFDVFERRDDPRITAHFGPIYGHQDAVAALLAPYENVFLHPGVFPDSATGALAALRFSFVHLDLDLPEATGAALDYFLPRLNAGGILIGDDYADPAVRAVFEGFFVGRPDTYIELPWGQIMIVKQP
jgi:O-methyltransferase